jgi:hypothetical protein
MEKPECWLFVRDAYTRASSSAWGTGSGLSSSPLISEKIAVLAPRPSARVSHAAEVAQSCCSRLLLGHAALQVLCHGQIDVRAELCVELFIELSAPEERYATADKN